jgi:hypothetical protein
MLDCKCPARRALLGVLPDWRLHRPSGAARRAALQGGGLGAGGRASARAPAPGRAPHLGQQAAGREQRRGAGLDVRRVALQEAVLQHHVRAAAAAAALPQAARGACRACAAARSAPGRALSARPRARRPRRSWDPGTLCRKADRPPSKSDVALPRAYLLIARAPLQAGASLADRPGPPHRPRRRRRRRPPRHRRPGPSRAWRGRPRAGALSAARPPAGTRPPGPRAPSPSRRTAARAARRPPVSGGAAALPGSVMRRSGCAPRREHPSSDSALAASASLSSEHSARGSAA